jgi:hypothetical protein
VTPDSIKRALRTAIVAALVIWIPGLLGWLNAVTQWARDEGATPFPDAHGLAYLGVSAIVGGVIGLVQWILNVIEDGIGHGFLRTVPPRPAKGQGGRADVLYVLAVVLVIVVILILVL